MIKDWLILIENLKFFILLNLICGDLKFASALYEGGYVYQQSLRNSHPPPVLPDLEFLLLPTQDKSIDGHIGLVPAYNLLPHTFCAEGSLLYGKAHRKGNRDTLGST